MQLRGLLLALAAAGCTAQADPVRPEPTSAASVAAAPDQRKAYFGDLHLHTSYSLDAWSIMGTKTTPDQAYRFARGETITYLGGPARRAWALDFAAVTDHAENLGVLSQLDDPTSKGALSDLGRRILANPSIALQLLRGAAQHPEQIAGLDPKAAGREAWAREMQAANGNYQPGRFTTFVAYEWSSMPKGLYNLHRNVIFAGDSAPAPFTSNDSPKPEDLWSYLEKARANGFDVLAIPHNSNVSNGLMFDWNDSEGRPIDEAYAQRRVLNEPLVEIAQNKGQSDTVPELSANDEFANFEVFDTLLSQPDTRSAAHGSYVREAYGRGLVIQQKASANPFKMGVVGATDFHNGMTTQDESAFAGGAFGADPDHTLPDGDAARRALDIIPTPAYLDFAADKAGRPHVAESQTKFGSGGLTGVWAEQNTREAIFAALKRRETFATSGPRIRVRFFGGWSYPQGLLSRPDWVRAAYAQGAPMGGDLPARPQRAAAPSFVVQAVKAPDSGALERVQVIKLWLDGDGYRERVFDVASSGGGKGPGRATLQTVWRDPEFRADRAAVYYVRVLEVPTPRWTARLAAKRGLKLPDGVAATIQERAWSSPIWYTPPPGLRS